MATLADVLRGYTPPTESALADPIKRHIASIPQKFEENQKAQMDLLARAFPGNTYESMMTQGDPKALTELAMQVPFNAMVAYHGTPHKILGKFDISKVGTGEGAQAYGHGMYFAENPAVAKEYQNMLGSRIDVNGKPLYNANKTIGSTGNAELDDYLVANLGDVKATRKQLLADIKEIRPTNPEAAKEMQNTLADLRKANVGVQNTGNLYKVDIPDEYIPNMLDWDKPISQQSKEVKKALAPYIEQYGLPMDEPGRSAHSMMLDIIGARQGLGPGSSPKKFQALAPQVAEELNKIGIKGIRYLDAGSRNKAAERSSNFVVFEPSTVKILEENSKPVSRKEIIEKQVKALKD